MRRFQRSMLFFLLVLVQACGEKAPSITSKPEYRELKGTALDSVHKVLGGRVLSACDAQNQAKMEEVARALDERKVEIEAFIAKSAGATETQDRWNHVKLGPITVRTLKAEMRPKNEWIEDTESWDSIYQEYLKIKETPVSEAWVSLNREALGILPDDLDRVEGYPQYFSHADGPKIKALSETIQACLDDSNCEEPADFQKMVADLFPDHPVYPKKALSAHALASKAQKRESLKGFLDLLQDDQGLFRVRKNPGVKRSDAGTLRLEMDPSAFSSVKEQLAGYIESVWKSDGLRVVLDWVQGPNSFQFFIDAGSGGRSYVIFRKKEVHLYNEVRARSIAHEIGHVLGFYDHYYTRWDEKSCVYRTEFNLADLMSDSTVGQVQPESWNQLNEIYPLKQAIR